VGIGTALLDFCLAIALSGGTIQLLIVLSNAGRVIAGYLGGLLARRRPSAPSSATPGTPRCRCG
ncbi:MAG: hypothetical protein AAGK32_10000, partial [Actinomycetota bacterium]